MKFKDLYLKGLDRKVNPAVSASDLDDKTVQLEINEYVFTDDIINNLYEILSNIRENQGSSSGIWIDGYYGSGKSHFLKYLDYCLSPKYGKEAFARLHDAVAEREPMTLKVEVGELDDMIRWFTNKAQVETVMFNIGTVHNPNSDENSVFTQVFWNRFNGMRGYNDSHLALAECLEKALDDDGKYEEFLNHVADEGYDWKRNIARFSGAKLDLAINMAKDVDPNLSYDAIRERVLKNDINVSVEAFADELKEYLDKKADKNYRLVFLCDEISQFIDNRGGLLLQLQEVVKRCFEECNSQVWFACTAQQDLSQIIQSSSIQKTNEDYGKIMGRFEVRTSLQSTKPEVITQKRILEKKGDVELQLEDIYNKNKQKLEAQFILPTTYNSYHDAKEFADYYPFVPYQFHLIQRVLDSFVVLDFVDRQVKGGERSLINITFSIAKETADYEVGEFIPFDKFFGTAFQGSMKHDGILAMRNARQALDQVTDKKKKAFYERVVYVLFMICNLDAVNKPQFSATVDNVVTLLMTKLDESKAAIKNDVSEALAYLMEKAVIRREKTDNGTEIYEFYTVEESRVAHLISNTSVDGNTYSEELHNIIFPYLGNPSNKFTFGSRSFNIGASIDGRNYLSNNADVVIEFLTTATTKVPSELAFNNKDNHMVFFLYPLLDDNKDLRSMFLEYCRVVKFIQNDSDVSDERRRVNGVFSSRARDMKEKEIKPQLEKILNECPIIAGKFVLTDAVIGKVKGAERYDRALDRHFSTLYDQAKLIKNEYPKTLSELQSKILAPIDKTRLGEPVSPPAEKIKQYIDRSPHDMTVAEIEHNFAGVPYGWSDLATIYFLNELVRRHLYSYAYNNTPVDNRKDIANNIVREAARYTVEPAKAISQKLINDFIASWKAIFNVVKVDGSNDSSELFHECREGVNSPMVKIRSNISGLLSTFAGRPFTKTLNDFLTLTDTWLSIRDHQKFFETVIADKDKGQKLVDVYKNIYMFERDQKDAYNRIFDFIDKNKGNFEFLDDENVKSAQALMGIKDDSEPWTHFQAYTKILNPLRKALSACREELVKQVKEAYTKVFAQLDAYAAQKEVKPDEYDNHEQTIREKTRSENFFALKDATNTDEFFRDKIAEINTIAQGRGAGSQRIKVVNLRTRTNAEHPLCNTEDIDEYLSGLREQLIKLLGDNDGIIVS